MNTIPFAPRHEPTRPWQRALLLAAAVALVASSATVGAEALFRHGQRASAGGSPAAARRVTLTKSSLTVGQIYTRTVAGVVDVVATTASTDPWGRERSLRDEGSGFVIDKAGDVVTCAHVVNGADTITVTFKDGTSAKARLIGSETATDVAVLRVSLAVSRLVPLALANSSGVKVGDPVVAIGSPFGYAESATSGIVSAVGRSITSPDGATIKDTIQTDAAINSGNSGGPLIDAYGKVIGVNAQIASRSGGNEGIGFAVSSNTTSSAVQAILRRGA